MVFLSEDDRVGHHGLHIELLNRAREDGLAGATVWKGIEGFGSSGRFRTARFPDAVVGLPLALELVDSAERIDAFLAVIKELAPGSFVTREQVEMSHFGSSEVRGLDDPAPREVHRP
jgi:PII-like signaling protein